MNLLHPFYWFACSRWHLLLRTGCILFPAQHLDGHAVTLKRSKITQPNYVLRVKGEGMPQFEEFSNKGDLYCTFTVGYFHTLSHPRSIAAAHSCHPMGLALMFDWAKGWSWKE